MTDRGTKMPKQYVILRSLRRRIGLEFAHWDDEILQSLRSFRMTDKGVMHCGAEIPRSSGTALSFVA
ncbi:MAG TPA: hypothetical protein DHW42_06130, partial [Candidatus Marinimicrobia bacterium]|nr:hypothetical protein [Candidatus Neomarinimicrobiota bacterium]